MEGLDCPGGLPIGLGTILDQRTASDMAPALVGSVPGRPVGVEGSTVGRHFAAGLPLINATPDCINCLGDIFFGILLHDISDNIL